MSSTTIIVHDEKDEMSSKACPLPSNFYAPTLYSRSDLRKEFVRILKIHGDVLSAEEMATWLGMEEDDVINIGDTLCVDQSEEHKSQCKDEVDAICKVYSTSKKNYQYALVKRLRHEIEERIEWQSGETLEYTVPKQSSFLSDTIAQELELTSEDVMRLSHGIAARMDAPMNDHPYLENQILASLSGNTAPTSLEKLFDDKDLALVISITRTLCQQGRLPGSVSASSNNVVYTPDVFTHFQRNVIDSFFRTDGYITEKKCVGAGLSRNRMECFVKESFPNAALLAHTMIDPGIICQPLEVAIQSAVLNFGYADLRSLIPLDIASNNDDVEQVINGCLIDALKSQQDTATFEAFKKGTTIINADIALFFSNDMSKESVKMLDAEIERYSKQRAKEIVDNKIGTGPCGKKWKPAPGSTVVEMISLCEVVNCIGNNYPDLKQSQQEYEGGTSCETSLSWISDEVGRCDGPLIEFCRTVLYRDVESKCSRAVRAEVASLESTRQGVSVSDRAVGAAKQMDKQEEFETSFRDLCHLLQIMSKTVENFSARDLFTSAEITSMKRECVAGMGSCLARLITEHCMYRNNVEGSRTFAYSRQDDNIISSIGTQAHVSALDFPSFTLQLNPADGGQQKDPLQYLREIIPGSSGLNLVRLWKVCGDAYVDDDNKDGDGLLEQFISHLEDSCLTLVGIPFSFLDKKTEKKVLAARRQGLIERLEKSSQHDEILNTCVILIYQQTKNLMISGKTMTSLVMKRFGEEKKIPTRVTEVLLRSNLSPELLLLVKQFGKAKNSKALAAICETST